MKRLLSACLLATAMFGGPAIAADGEPSPTASYSIGITGYVPVICRTSLDASVIPSSAGAVPLGNLQEFCNSPNGYQIFVDSSPELANATLVVGGREVTLSASGPTLVSASNGPAITSNDVVLHNAGGASGHLSFRIVAL